MMRKIPRSYQWPVGLAVALHVLLLIVLWVDIPQSSVFRTTPSTSSTKIVNAIALNQAQVEQQVQRVKQQENEKKAAEQARRDRLKKQAAAAKAERLAKQKRLAQRKAQKIQAAKRRLAQQKALKTKKAAQAKALARKRADAKKTAEAKKRASAKKAAEAKALAAKRAKEKAAKLAAQQDALQKKLMDQQFEAERKALAQAKAQEMQGMIDQYKGRILQAIQQQWILPDSASQELTCVFLIHLGPGGVVINVTLVRSSGDAVLDRSAQVAVFKASPLPVPKDPSVFDRFRELRLTVRPETIAG